MGTLKEAEGFGPETPRLATSPNNLAGLNHAQGIKVEAELPTSGARDRRKILLHIYKYKQ